MRIEMQYSSMTPVDILAEVLSDLVDSIPPEVCDVPNVRDNIDRANAILLVHKMTSGKHDSL